jgi:acetyl/propionyl-CoA carboxylase alpha subunit
VFADTHGECVYLFERDCSVQRRHQKVLEEAPAPGMTAERRAAMGDAAVAAAKAVGYVGAGTVEFIANQDGSFHFMEMNTRLQVEHPVTECVLNVDLVAEQLRIASGMGLSFSQQDLVPRGHAIECRICAEEPEHDFRPATGRIGILEVPRGANIRFDGGVRAGQTVTPAFDSMLAKLVAHGQTRTEAAAALADALDELVLLGVATNIDYLGRVLRHPQFLAGRLHTGFLLQHAAELSAPYAPQESTVAALAALLADPDFHRAAFEAPEPHATIGPWRN